MARWPGFELLLLNFPALPQELPPGKKAERGSVDLTGIVPGRGARRAEGDGRGAAVLAARQLQESSRLPRQGIENFSLRLRRSKLKVKS